MDEAQEAEFIDKAVESIQRSVGVRPYGWLSRYFHSDNTRRLLIERGFSYHMDDYSGDVPYWDRTTVPARPIVILPYQLDTNDMKMWTDPAMTPVQWLDYAKRSFDQLYREGEAGNPKMMSLGLHLRIIGRPGRIWALEEFLKHVTSKPDIWIASRGQIAEHFANVEPA
jgi:peptidoglycan/xylan/chitin deacetylase (PgdA/CDA1 family)